LDLWWNIGYLQGPPRDGAYGYIPLNIPPRAPSRTPRLNNMQIYIEIYCYSTRHQGTMLHEMSSICSCDIPPRVWGREARHQGRKNKKKSICIIRKWSSRVNLVEITREWISCLGETDLFIQWMQFIIASTLYGCWNLFVYITPGNALHVPYLSSSNIVCFVIDSVWLNIGILCK
jgi:hypothetical protein